MFYITVWSRSHIWHILYLLS